eukprot:CAMPEP_0204505194 /NCGR_PEP_ID=MMETSP0471-20130131/107065_1 /ASSEMBLY_ACC=CAM_ASM_000602 /TAXON_ID=2969 /ORGANISM="Oxyrrhis marina" /LENGTH=132 /DNA_ID=CAMNT_0051510119 /DNA_START=68 /DNA_END=468 /DNA_ORIENTATION=+
MTRNNMITGCMRIHSPPREVYMWTSTIFPVTNLNSIPSTNRVTVLAPGPGYWSQKVQQAGSGPRLEWADFRDVVQDEGEHPEQDPQLASQHPEEGGHQGGVEEAHDALEEEVALEQLRHLSGHRERVTQPES